MNVEKIRVMNAIEEKIYNTKKQKKIYISTSSSSSSSEEEEVTKLKESSLS